jgi:hypothetical protein
MKKYLVMLLVVLMMFTVIPGIVGAAKVDPDGELTKGELKLLENKVGLTQEDIDHIPTDILRQFIAENAKKISVGPGVKKYDVPSEGNGSSEGFSTMGTIPDEDLEMWAIAMRIGTDRPGFKKIQFFATYDWAIDPAYALTDKISIGYPTENKFFLPTSGGKVTQHKSQYCHQVYYWQNATCVSSTTPSDINLGAGVAAAIDLKFNSEYHEGSISQFAYVAERETGTSNVMVRYGHKRISGSPSVQVYPGIGLSITPTATTDTMDYIFELSW